MCNIETEFCFSREEKFLIKTLFRDEKILFNPSEINEKILLDIATKNGLAQLLYLNDVSKQFSEEAQQHLKNEYLFNFGKNAAIQSIAAEITQILSEKEIPVIYLKGISLITNVYSDIALRPMSDLDIMVPSQAVFEAWKLINPQNIEIKLIDIKTGHHLPIFKYKGINVELHRFLYPSDVKYQMPIDEIWQNAINLPNVNALILSPIHQIIYQLLHLYYTCRQGGLRLGWFYDIKALLINSCDQITLEEVENQAKKWKIDKPIKQMLAFFTVLCPENKLSFSLSDKNKKEIIKMIDLLHISDSKKKSEYGYGIALERLANTKGLKNKIIFLFNAISDDGTGKRRFSIKRIGRLMLKMINFCYVNCKKR